MRVLVACESSGIVRDAFRRRGHDAYSCDLLQAASDPQYHYQCDARDIIGPYHPWDLIIAHPPCTYLCSSGLHWNKRRPGRAEQTESALELARFFLNADCGRIAVENPVGCISTRIRKYDQKIQPYEFGEDASKATCLWLKNLPPLKPTQHVPGRLVWDVRRQCHVERWANQTDSGQSRLGPSPTRWQERSQTYEGIAEAMADQWGCL